MKVTVWGARGSVPAPGPETARYGGNTSCVHVALDDGSEIVLDAGTGIRCLGLAMAGEAKRISILLTHLHMDHIQGLMFFPPLFRPDTDVIVYGPASSEASLMDRVARYISAPLSPVEVRELPCQVSFRDAPDIEWQIGSATIRANSVTHRGPTLGYRITDGDSSLAYIPDHEPALGPTWMRSRTSGSPATRSPATLRCSSTTPSTRTTSTRRTWAGATRASATRWRSRTASARSGSRSSTTTRCTRTTCSTAS